MLNRLENNYHSYYNPFDNGFYVAFEECNGNIKKTTTFKVQEVEFSENDPKKLFNKYLKQWEKE